MKNSALIAILVFVCLVIEAVFFEILGRWFMPNLIIILIVFFNLSRGIRASLIAAMLAGLVKDCYSPTVFGVHIFSFIACAYMTTFIKMYLYQVGSDASRILIVLIITAFNVFTKFTLNTILNVPVSFTQVFVYVLIPEVVMTVIVTVYTFEKLKRCVSKSFA